jgi:hypothetical protein
VDKWLKNSHASQMSKMRICIDRANQGPLAKAAKEDGRSQVKQLNHLLSGALKARAATKTSADQECPSAKMTKGIAL